MPDWYIDMLAADLGSDHWYVKLHVRAWLAGL